MFFKNCFSPKTSTDTEIAGFATLAKLSLEVNIRSESEKIANYSLLKRKYHKLFPRTSIAVLPTLKKFFPPLSRKLQKLSDNPRVFNTSIRKCWSVSVALDKSKVFLTTLPESFLQKHRLFLSKSKKDEKQIVQQSFWQFSPVHLDYCFTTPD